MQNLGVKTGGIHINPENGHSRGIEKSRQLLTILEVAPSSSESGKEFTDADRADADLVHTLQRPEHIVVSSLRMRVDVGIDQKSSHFHSSGSMDR
jgi:hypothetical protein